MKKFKYKIGDIFITSDSMFIVLPSGMVEWNLFTEETLIDPEDEWIKRRVNCLDVNYRLLAINYAFNLKEI